MGLQLHTTSSYFQMDDPPDYGYFNFGRYVNTAGTTRRLVSVTIYAGTGSGTFTAGETARGDGGSFELRIYAGGSSSGICGNATITNAMYPVGGGWPDRNLCQKYTFTFNNPPSVASGGSVELWWAAQNVSGNKVLCFDYESGYTTDTESNYTVTFDLAGGTRTGGGELVQSVAPGGSAIPPTCSREGYTFAGWSGDYTNITSNRTITALWSAQTYTISYNANGGSGAPGNQTKSYGQSITLASATPTASYTITYDANGGSVSPGSKSVTRPFRTWNTRADGTGTDYAPGAVYTANAPLTLYAQYSNPTMGSLPTPSRSSCQFNRWTTSRNGGSTVSSSTTVTGNMTIYAFWNYLVVLNGNGNLIIIGNSMVESTSTYVAHGSNYTIPNYAVKENLEWEATPSKTFKGWSTSSSGSAQYLPGSNFGAVTSPVTLYAIMEINTYTVTFVDGFNSHSVSQQVQHGQSATPPTDSWVQQNWARPGYVFAGWLGSYEHVTSDRIITALWSFTPVWIMKSGKWVPYKAK